MYNAFRARKQTYSPATALNFMGALLLVYIKCRPRLLKHFTCGLSPIWSTTVAAHATTYVVVLLLAYAINNELQCDA